MTDTRFIQYKDTKNNIIIMGGLGVLGVGIMPLQLQERHKNYPGYDDAPEKDLSHWEKVIIKTEDGQ